MSFEKFPFKTEKQFRLKNFDYSQNGYYFVTICTHNKEKIFGDISFTNVGTDPCVRSCNLNTTRRSCNLNTTCVGSTKNIHSIKKAQTHGSVPTKNLYTNDINQNKLFLNDIGRMVEKYWLKLPNKFPEIFLDEYIIMPDHVHGIIIIKNIHSIQNAQTHGSVPTINSKFGNVGLLGQTIRWFKTMTTNEYIKNINICKWPKFQNHLWQPRFHDRIIRNEKEYFAIKQYIKDNSKNREL